MALYKPYMQLNIFVRIVFLSSCECITSTICEESTIGNSKTKFKKAKLLLVDHSVCFYKRYCIQDSLGL